MVHGDLEAAFAESDVIVENTYHTKANAQAMMETFRTYSYLDHNGRLTLVSSTQVPFHIRRHVARALGLPKTKVRVIKPRIGGGFGAKQTMVSEIYPAFVTQKIGKPAAMIFTREETFKASTSRHEMQIRVKVGSDKEGNIKAIDLYTLSNTGAYGEHDSTVVGLSGHKTIPLYNKTKAFRFDYDVVYSNTMSAGAFRGYGATQGIFALESTALKACLLKGKEMIGWDQKYPYRQVGKTKVHSVGMAMTMQGSAIADIDVAAVEIRLSDDGFYTLMIGATDMGTGCDMILAQIVAECLECEMEIIDYVGVVDCGTVEDIQYNEQGKMMNNSFMQYKIPSRLDVGKVRVAFESSYEPTGPFGAKSIGEVVINTPSPALAHAVYNGTGVAVRTLPIRPEKIVAGILK